MSYNFVYFQEVGVYGSRHVPPQAAWTVNPLWSLGGVHLLVDFFLNFQNDMMDFHENWGLYTEFA